MKILITDASGKIVCQRQANSSKEYFELSGLKSGVYMLRVFANESLYTEKLIIK